MSPVAVSDARLYLAALSDARAARRVYSAAVLADQPVAYLRFGDLSSVAVDSSGHGHNGTYFGGFSLRQPSALVGDSADRAAHFMGAYGGRIDIPDAPELRFDGPAAPFSIEIFVKPDTLGAINAFPHIVAKQHFAPSRTAWLLFGNDGGSGPLFAGNRFNAGVFLGGVNAPANSLPLRAWTYCHWTYDGTNHRLYANGVLVGGPSATDTGTITAGGLLDVVSVASTSGGGSGFATIATDELALYAGALTPGQIAGHWDAAKGLVAGGISLSDARAAQAVPTTYGELLYGAGVYGQLAHHAAEMQMGDGLV